MRLLSRLQRVAGRAPAAGGADKGSADNRVAPRRPRYSTAQLLVYPQPRHPRPIDVQVTDYSATGIGVIHSEGLLVGEKFVVREPHVTDGNTCLFTVVRSDPRPDGTFSIGLHVGNSLDDEHNPLLELERAPGIAWSSKLLFVAFALLGATMIIAVALLKHQRGG
jgi:hypothetical protein